ncbi:YjfK family protein [Desulfosediminicola sp.]|uniref:YjfK family protein n=1 Tax=Desulfosediminicola sp. TaxID=2886825 RepID=UPI003AF23231
MFNPFKKKISLPRGDQTPRIMGLGLGGSFELDALWVKLMLPNLQVDEMAVTQIIEAAGLVDWDDTLLFRFYTDDDAWLQVVASGKADTDVEDVSLFHYYDTLDVGNDAQWASLLDERIGAPTYELNGKRYQRVWTCDGDYHNPVHMREQTWNAPTSGPSQTDQFAMLFERHINDQDDVELLFVSAEETENEGTLERCLVLSTGVKLTPSQLTIHG